MTLKMQEAGKTSNQAKNDREVTAASYAEPTNKEQFPEREEDQADNAVLDSDDFPSDEEWLMISRDAHETSQSYFDSSIRTSIERNLAHFGGRHAPGSKYYNAAYKFRAKGFRPKTRSVLRRSEAQAAKALFSTTDAVTITAENDSIEDQKISAEVNQKLIDYRLRNSIPWFQTALGAYQDASVAGICISHQYWEFDEIKIKIPLDDEDGPVYEENGEVATGLKRFVSKDAPKIDLRPVENVRFSPDCSWVDPVGTSAYLIDELPMQVGDIKKMATREEKTTLKWIMPTDGQLLAGGLSQDYNPIRQQREAKREDSKDQRHAVHDFDVVWVHRNIIKKNGIDWIFFTLGEYQMLTNVVPLGIEYPHLAPGQRPYTCGTSVIETHKSYPDAPAGMVSSLQQEANEISNQRRDNVQLTMNRRYFARRGANIQYSNLTRSVPGGVVEMDNITQDIRSEAPPDVTGSSYQEQERINLDFDELAGNFSSGSVGSNRNLNETVGGMEMLSADADDVTEYSLRTFVETWVKPTLKQLIQLEQRFETNEALLSQLGSKLELWKRYGIDRVTDELLQGSMLVELNIGFGATNPMQRVDKLAKGISTVVNLDPNMAARIDSEEIAEEIFGALGYESSKRFFKPADEVEQQEPQPDPRIQVEMIREEGKGLQREHESALKESDQEHDRVMKLIDGRLKQMEMDLNRNLELMRQKGSSQDSLDKIKADFAQLVIKLKSTERLAGKKATADMLPKPPIEPPGRAKPGESFAA